MKQISSAVKFDLFQSILANQTDGRKKHRKQKQNGKKDSVQFQIHTLCYGFVKKKSQAETKNERDFKINRSMSIFSEMVKWEGSCRVLNEQRI